jgi:hypothetical protein
MRVLSVLRQLTLRHQERSVLPNCEIFPRCLRFLLIRCRRE